MDLLMRKVVFLQLIDYFKYIRVPASIQYKKGYPGWDSPFYGAADGTRTRTVSLPGDFKSPVSTDSTTAAAKMYDITLSFYRQVRFVCTGIRKFHRISPFYPWT